MHVRKGYTLAEVIICVSVVAIVTAIVVPMLGPSRRSHHCGYGSTQVRGIQQALVLFSNGNNSFYAGIDGSTGKKVGPITATATEYGAAAPSNTDLSAVYAILMTNDYFTTDYALSSCETDDTKQPGPAISSIHTITKNDY